MEFLDQEVVEAFRRLELLVHLVFILGTPTLLAANRYNLAENISLTNLMAMSARSTSSVTSTVTVVSREASTHLPTLQEACPVFQGIVNRRQFPGQQLIVVAKLKQLRIDVFENLD